MNWNQNQGILQEFINNVKEQWIWFIDDQIDVLDGKQSHFYGKTQKVYGIDNDEAEKRLAHWQKMQNAKGGCKTDMDD
ncbi:MAG: CsbD family protein [Methyloglobulus sp.]